MTSLAIREGWAMTSTAPTGGPRRSAWREVVVAWAMAAVLAGALVLTVSHHDKEGSDAGLWSLAPAASHAHQKAADPEGPGSDETCSDRDYANERC
jgi:anti-sigma-K factor RskA